MQQEQQAKQLALTVPPQVLQEAAQMQMQMQAPQGAPGPTAPQGIASLPPQGMPQGMPQQAASLDQGVGGLPDTGIDQTSFAGGGIVAFSGATDDRSLVKGGENNPVEYPNPGANVQPTDIEELLRRAVGMTEEEKQAYREMAARPVKAEERAALNKDYPMPSLDAQPMEQLTDQAPLPEGTSERSGAFRDMRDESQVVRAGGNDFNQQLGGINALPTAPEQAQAPAPAAEEAPGAQYFPQAKFSDFDKQSGGQGVASLPEAAAVPRATPTATPTAPQGKVPKTVRYNNPLALWDTKTNDLRKYDTYEEGKAAGQRDLDIKLAGKSAIFNSRFPDGIVTPERLAEVWSPAAAKGNSKVATEAYGRYIANYLGIKPTDPIPPGKNAQVFEVMSQFESGIGSGKGAFKQSPTVVDPRDGGIRQFGVDYKNDPTITHDFRGTPGVGERLLAAVTGSKDAGAAEDSQNAGKVADAQHPSIWERMVKSGKDFAGSSPHQTLFGAMRQKGREWAAGGPEVNGPPTSTRIIEENKRAKEEAEEEGAPTAPEAPSATTKPVKPVKAPWDSQSILDRAGDYGKYMGVNPQVEQAGVYATGKTEQADKAEKNRMYDLMIRGGTQAALAAAKPGSGQGLAGLMNAASHGASAAADQNQVLTDRISALRKEGFDTKKDAAAAQRAEKVSALKFGEDAYHHAGTIAASFANAESRQGGGKAAQMRAHASEFKTVLDNVAKDARSMAGSPEDRKTARMQYNEMLEEYRSMAQRIARAEALEAGEDYTPGTTAKPPTDAYPGFKDRTKK